MTAPRARLVCVTKGTGAVCAGCTWRAVVGEGRRALAMAHAAESGHTVLFEHHVSLAYQGAVA